MDSEKTYGGVDPEIFELMRTFPVPTDWELVATIQDEEVYNLSTNEQEADELGKVIMDLESSGEQH